MSGPHRMGISLLQPGEAFENLFSGGLKCHTVLEVLLPIAVGIELGTQEVESTQGSELKCTTREKRYSSIFPAGW